MRAAISDHFRGQRDQLLRDVITRSPRSGATLRILDIGGRVAYWRRFGIDFLKAQNVRITLINVTETEMGMVDDAPDMFESLVGNGCKLDSADNAFDLCHSNSVIEHVGLWRDMEAFARETRRIAPSYYCQSPNFWFPIDPHFPLVPFNHWMPRPFRMKLMRWLPLAHSGRARDLAHAAEMVDGARMITGEQMRFLFPDARIQAERFALLAKSYTAVRLAQP